MKNTIKSVTFTLDELRNMLAVTLKSGDTRAANQVIRKKLSEKAERLARQREQRRLRAEQKKSAVKDSEKSAKSASPENATPSNNLTISLNRALATCILWINNRSKHLKNNILCILHEIARNTNHPDLKSIESAIDSLLKLTAQAATPAYQHLHAPFRSRPTRATITI